MTEDKQNDIQKLLEGPLGPIIHDYREHRVDVGSAIEGAMKTVRSLNPTAVSDLERLQLENRLERLALERDPIKALDGLSSYENMIRGHYIASIGLSMRNGKYGNAEDREAMLQDAARMFVRINGYKEKEE